MISLLATLLSLALFGGLLGGGTECSTRLWGATGLSLILVLGLAAALAGLIVAAPAFWGNRPLNARAWIGRTLISGALLFFWFPYVGGVCSS